VHFEHNEDRGAVFSVQSNPDFNDGQCSRVNTLTPALIHLQSYDISSPCGHMGMLFRPDYIVIPDYEFTIKFTFPMENMCTLRINKNSETSVRELLHMIKTGYEHIYDEEEETSNTNTFVINKLCEACNEKTLYEFIDIIPSIELPDDQQCAICYRDYLEDPLAAKLSCGHIFHTDCVKSWIVKGNGKGCPLCRSKIRNCRTCEGRCYVESHEEFVVLPVEHRDAYMSRNRTDGMYGIFDYDFENLVIEELEYNSRNKMLHIMMTIM